MLFHIAMAVHIFSAKNLLILDLSSAHKMFLEDNINVSSNQSLNQSVWILKWLR